MTALDTLRMLEEDFPSTPSFAREAELERINALRTELGMPPARNGADLTKAPPPPAPKPKPVRDHTEGRAVYEAYLRRLEELRPHQEYALRVAKATADTQSSMTPVRPLVTLGTNGGPLLCDHCGLPMILEGGQYDKMYADKAWDANPDRKSDWVSYIKGGMVVDRVENGTVRVYHGYTHKPEDCCSVALRKRQKEYSEFTSLMPSDVSNKLWAFLKDEFPGKTEKELCDIFGKVNSVLFSYDPGLGVNLPELP